MREILIHAGIGETRIALVVDGRLERYESERLIGGPDGRIGDIILGRVTRVMPAMEAAFVDIGWARAGFLSFRDTAARVTEGQEIMVQVIREPVGEKGARLTAVFTVPEDIAGRRKSAKPPATLGKGPGAIERALHGMATPDVMRIRVQGANAFEAVRAWCHAHDCESKIETCASGLFDEIEDEIDGLSRTRVDLSSGGWLTIEPTEGLTAIDVNSGNHQAASREEAALAVNLEAANESGRQLRLRGIGGLIVVDFIQIAEARKILAALEESIGQDGAPSDISFLPKLCVAVIARKRPRAPLPEHEACPACGGAGRRRSPESIGFEILRRVERAAAAAPGKPVLVRAAPDVVRWLDGQGVRPPRVSFEPDASLARERFDVGTRP
ncbi:MAG TPA: ribonuclease E/G [Rhizomicrobium sp.]